MNTLVRFRFRLLGLDDEQRFGEIISDLEGKLRSKVLDQSENTGELPNHKKELEALTQDINALLEKTITISDAEPILFVWDCMTENGVELDLSFPDNVQIRVETFLRTLSKMGASDVSTPLFKHVSDEQLMVSDRQVF